MFLVQSNVVCQTETTRPFPGVYIKDLNFYVTASDGSGVCVYLSIN